VTHTDEVRHRVLAFLETACGVRPDTEGRLEVGLLSGGLLDSLSVLKLVSFIEDGFGVSLEPDYIHPDEMDSPSQIAALIDRLQREQVS
jgi:D-alanine--poly(phosphoribitol) ligase subunit 2